MGACGLTAQCSLLVGPSFPSRRFSFESCYGMYLLLWACIEVPWSACELDEQIAVQVTLTMGRSASFGNVYDSFSLRFQP